jgi:hypothetical protein
MSASQEGLCSVQSEREKHKLSVFLPVTRGCDAMRPKSATVHFCYRIQNKAQKTAGYIFLYNPSTFFLSVANGLQLMSVQSYWKNINWNEVPYRTLHSRRLANES